jgi:hypothetical protein
LFGKNPFFFEIKLPKKKLKGFFFPDTPLNKKKTFTKIMANQTGY